MYLAIPKDFFVPVLFSEEFNLNEDTQQMEYDSDFKNSYRSMSRSKLFDLDDTDVNEEIKCKTRNDFNEAEEKLDAHISKFTENFLNHVNKVDCLKLSEGEAKNKLNMHIANFKKVYDIHIKRFEDLPEVLSPADIDGIIDNHINRFTNVFNKHLEKLNCNDFSKDVIEKLLSDHIKHMREVLRKHMEEVNSIIINRRDVCEKGIDVKNNFDNNDKIYSIIDDEFSDEMTK
ncbi:hypothetical protein JCM1393_04440 [Clostridium carnis]